MYSFKKFNNPYLDAMTGQVSGPDSIPVPTTAQATDIELGYGPKYFKDPTNKNLLNEYDEPIVMSPHNNELRMDISRTYPFREQIREDNNNWLGLSRQDGLLATDPSDPTKTIESYSQLPYFNQPVVEPTVEPMPIVPTTERVNGAGQMMYNPYANNLTEPMMPVTSGINTGVVPSAKVTVPTGDLLMQAPPVPVTPQMQGLEMPNMESNYTNMFPQYVPKPTIQEPTVPRDMKFKDSYDMRNFMPKPVPHTVGENVTDNSMQRGTEIQLDVNGYPISIPQIGTPTAPVVSPTATTGQPTNEIPGLKLNVGSTMMDFTKPPTVPPVPTTTTQAPTTEPTINPQTGMIQTPKFQEEAAFQDPKNTLPGTGQPITDTKNPYDIPEMYYAGKAILDAGALFNNMVQAPPPNMQFETPKFERMRLDRTPFETARTDVREAQVASNRTMREGISQASDLMRGLSAVTAGTQDNMSQIGTQEAGAQLGVEQQNQQIAMQEAQAQNAINNQEMQVNYQIQAAAKEAKNQHISAQLGRIGDTAGAYANYIYTKEQADKMTKLSKEQAGMANELQLEMMKYQASQNELGSASYAEGERAAINKYISETKDKLYTDPRYEALKAKYGDNYDPLLMEQRQQEFQMKENRLKNFETQYKGFTEEPVRKADEPENDWLSRQDQWQKAKDMYDRELEQFSKDKPIYDLDKQFYGELKGSFDTAGEREKYRSNYLKEKGLPTLSDLTQTVTSLIERSRQL